MKRWKFAGLTVVAVIVIAVVLQLAGVPGRFFAPVLKAWIEAATGYQVTKMDHVGLGLWPGLRLSADGIALDKADDPTGLNRLTAERIEADVPLSALWSGRADVSAVVVTRPVLYQPLLRRRLPEKPAQASAGTKPAGTGGRIDRVRIVGGEVAFARQRGHVDNRFGGIDAEAIMHDGRLTVNGSAEHGITFEFRSTDRPAQSQTIPLDFVMRIPDLSDSPLKGRTDLEASGRILSLHAVAATLGDSSFSGKAEVDLASKPLVTLELNVERLHLPVSTVPADPNPAPQAWSSAAFNSDLLNYVDADLKLAVGEVKAGTMGFSSVAARARLENGVMKMNLADGKPQAAQTSVPAGRSPGQEKTAGQGQVNANITLDVSGEKPGISIQSTLRDIPALPLLEAVAGFDRIEGRLQASIAVDSQGNSEQAVMSNLQGVVSLDFRDGAVRGINIAQMIRSLTSSPQDWQQSSVQKTDLSQLSASFSIDKGRAVTSDLKLVSPMVRVTGAGTVDLGAKEMALRVEPTLVMTLQGQGRGSEPGAFGVPLMISGPWSNLHIHPDVPGMLDSPEAFDTLEQIGAGLFGKGGLFGGNGASGNSGSGTDKDQPSRQGGEGGSGGGSGGGLGGGLGGLLGDLIQQGLSDGDGSRGQRRPRP